MSYGLLLGACVALALFLGGIGGLVWWVRRPVRRSRREGPLVLPLFGHDRAALYGRSHTDGDDGGDVALLMATRTARPQHG